MRCATRSSKSLIIAEVDLPFHKLPDLGLHLTCVNAYLGKYRNRLLQVFHCALAPARWVRKAVTRH